MFYLVLGTRKLRYDNLGDLVRDLEGGLYVDVEGIKEYDKVRIIIDPIINYVNHVFVMLGFNYTIGCPIDAFGKIPYEDIVSIIKTGLSRASWFILMSVLASEPSSIEELIDLMYEFVSFVRGGRVSKLRPAYNWGYVKELSNYYVGAENFFMNSLRYINEDSIDLLTKFMRKYWDNYYSRYWGERASRRLFKFKEVLTKVVPHIKPYELLTELTGLRPTFECIECFPVDVFRRGGGIYGALPNKIVITSDPQYVITVYTAILHEAGHLLVRGWKFKLYDSIREFAGRLGMEVELPIVWFLEELFMALLQRLADEELLGYYRITHGLMNTGVFNLAYSTYKELVRGEEEVNYYTFMESFMSNIVRSDAYIKECRKIIKEFTQ